MACLTRVSSTIYPTDGQLGVGSALPYLQPEVGYATIARADRQAVSYAMVSIVTRLLMSRQINSLSGMIGGMSARVPKRLTRHVCSMSAVWGAADSICSNRVLRVVIPKRSSAALFGKEVDIDQHFMKRTVDIVKMLLALFARNKSQQG
jgi:hypothetical protein